MAGHQARNLEARRPVAGDVAYFPEHMIPFVIAQHLRGLAFLAKKSGELLDAVVVNPQLNGDNVPARGNPDAPKRTID